MNNAATPTSLLSHPEVDHVVRAPVRASLRAGVCVYVCSLRLEMLSAKEILRRVGGCVGTVLVKLIRNTCGILNAEKRLNMRELRTFMRTEGML